MVSGLAVFVSVADDEDHWAGSGRACQRFALQATARGQLVAYLGTGGRRRDIVMRFRHEPELPKSQRRPVEQVLLRA